LWLLERDSALPYEAIAILAVVVLNALMGYIQQSRAERAVAALRQMSAARASVIRGGVRHLRSLQERFPGQLHLAIAAYNAGEGAVLRYSGIPPYAETRQYVSRVLRLYDQANVLPVSARRAGAADRAATQSASAKVYRQVGSDGTPHYSNLPPLVRTQSSPGR